MRRFLPLLAALVAVIGCGTLAPERRFEVLLARPAEADPLPVQVVDTTGLLVSVTDEPAGIEIDFSGRGAVVNPAGQPNVLSLQWIGGACDDGASLMVRIGGERRLRLELTTSHSGEVCADVGIFRALTLTFTQPVIDDDVRLEFSDT